MDAKDALFFYQLLVPFVDPAQSGIEGNPRIGYYEEVAVHTNVYAMGVKNRGGTRGHLFCPVTAEELVKWDGIVARNVNKNIAECWMPSHTNGFDPVINEAMSPCCWVDIKVCLKQNMHYAEKRRTEEGYDPTQKYRLIWDVMTHNMLAIIKKGGDDVTIDETTWANASYADMHGRLKGKNVKRVGST